MKLKTSTQTFYEQDKDSVDAEINTELKEFMSSLEGFSAKYIYSKIEDKIKELLIEKNYLEYRISDLEAQAFENEMMYSGWKEEVDNDFIGDSIIEYDDSELEGDELYFDDDELPPF